MLQIHESDQIHKVSLPSQEKAIAMHSSDKNLFARQEGFYTKSKNSLKISC